MQNILLSDPHIRAELLPLSYTRPVSELRIGILTITEKWQRRLNASVSFIAQDYLTNKYPAKKATDNIVIDGSLIPDDMLAAAVSKLVPESMLVHNGQCIACRTAKSDLPAFPAVDPDFTQIQYSHAVTRISSLADIIRLHGNQISEDFELITKGRKSESLSGTNRVIGSAERIFIEKGAKIECAILNTDAGPVYIAEDAEIMEGSIIRGPFGMGAHAVVKMAAKIYPNVSIGPHCKLGGEAGNSILHAYSNKGHDGYIGDSYIGEWCNLGADTNTSNLKNNYAEVKLWNYPKARFVNTGLQFCGLIMGDHSKAGINTMFNTGTVVGVSCNVFGDGYPRNFIPGFSWGGAGGLTTFALSKAYEASDAMMARRGLSLSDDDRKIFEHIWESDKEWRR